MYDVGDKVVYPHHGAGTVVKKEKREVLGQQREYLTIKILHNDMTVQVPSENAEKVGLRRVIGDKEIAPVLKALTHANIEVVAIHSHMEGETPKVIFLHYWGVGRAEDLARGVKAALDAQRK